MAYDRFDPRDRSRDERSRWSEDRFSDRNRSMSGEWRGERGGRDNSDDRGFFDRASDEVASWFGDEEAERRRREDQMRDEREGPHGGGLDRNRHRGDWNDNRGAFARGGSSESDYNRGWRRELSGGGDREQNRFREPNRFGEGGRDYRPMAGDYGRSDSEWDRDPYRGTSRAGTSDRSDRSRHDDPHYRSWRDRHLSDLDQDYDEYRRERQSQFESDFGSWRERRQQKRGLLVQIREHMEVVGNDDEHVGTVDKIAGDRIILTKSDPESGGAHHSLSCAEVDRVEEDRVILDCSADQARKRWRDENRSRALFERDDQGEMGPRMLDQSFEGTYR
jgi:hypothetical protein